MPAPLQLTIKENLQAGLRGLKPEEMREVIAAGMTEGADIMAGLITEERLTGKGPFPVADHKLGVVTGRLRMSLRSETARIDGDVITVAIGSPVEYAAAHEFGFSGKVTVPAHTREGKNGPIAVREFTRELVIPERAPVRTGMAEHLGEITDSIRGKLDEAMKGDRLA